MSVEAEIEAMISGTHEPKTREERRQLLKRAKELNLTGRASFQFKAGVLLRSNIRDYLDGEKALRDLVYVENKGWLGSTFTVYGNVFDVFEVEDFLKERCGG